MTFRWRDKLRSSISAALIDATRYDAKDLKALCRAIVTLFCRLWRVSYDSLAGGGCGELLNSAFHTITLIVAIRRPHLVVIRRVRLQIGHAHAENRLRMGPVDSYGRFRRLAQVAGIT